MKNITLSSVLLFALVIPFIMNFRLSIGETPYWLFGLIFLGLISFPVLDILSIKENLKLRLKHILMWVVIILVVGGAFTAAIIVRHQTSPIYMIHDIILQQESAIRFLLHGKNPYAENYLNTPMYEWHYSDKEVNPALYHFVMEPLYVIFSIPFHLVSNRLFGFFDGRIPLLFLFLCALIIGDRLIKDKEKKLQFLALFTFNPAMLGYTLEGRSDMFVFPFLFASLYALYKKKFIASAVLLAFAFCIKQSVWPFVPLYFFYLYLLKLPYDKLMRIGGVFSAIILLIIGPFLVWGPKAFIDSTINYLSGAVVHSYPISGYGFGMILLQSGIIKNAQTYFPFAIFQAIICLPLFILLFKNLKKNLSVQRLIVLYGILLFVFWYFSRYFNNSHAGFLTIIFIVAYFWPAPGDKKINES